MTTDDPEHPRGDPQDDLDVRHEVDDGRFVVDLEAGEAELVYRREDGTADFRSTFVPPEHREAGIGEAIVLAALRWAREEGLSVKPTCPFVSRVLERHEEFGDLVAD